MISPFEFLIWIVVIALTGGMIERLWFKRKGHCKSCHTYINVRKVRLEIKVVTSDHEFVFPKKYILRTKSCPGCFEELKKDFVESFSDKFEVKIEEKI